MKNWFSYLLLILLVTGNDKLIGQAYYDILLKKMEAYEIDIQNTYSEYQKVYYERKSSKNELKAFEDIISVYVSQILEIYETLALSSITTLDKPRDIAARSLIFRALTYLEKAPLNIEFYEKACYDYYNALDMYNESDKIPVILKPLPKPIKVGNKEYKRLIDLISKKGSKLYSFGKIKIVLKNFKITSNLDADYFEFIRFNSPMDKQRFTYNKAEAIIKKGFKEVFDKNSSISFFLALPEGSYFIRSKKMNNPLYPYLSAIYVRANQQQEYIAEPLVDWIIMYENPRAKQPNFLSSSNSKFEGKRKGNGNGIHHKKLKKEKSEALIISSINDAVNSSMEQIKIDKIFNLRDPWIRSRFSNVASKVIYSFISSSRFNNCWSYWMLAWDIATAITEKFSPGSNVPTELALLVYKVLQKF